MRDAGKVLDEAILSAYDGFTTTASGGRERIIRCPVCMDSDNPNHAHLSISLFKPFYYLCHRCKFSGAVNENFLKNLGVNITPELQEILKDNREAVKADAKNRNSSSSKQISTFLERKINSNTISLPPFSRDTVVRNIKKYNYLCKRFSHTFTKEELKLFKVVFDLKELVRYNSIMNLPVDVDFMNILNNEYIGFMNYSYEGVINRIIRPETNGEYRYFDLMFAKSPFRMFTFSQQLDLTKSKLKLIVAEGIFDLIGIYLAFPNLRNDYIFVAMLGHGIVSVMKFFIRLGFLNQKILIFSDADVTPEEYKAQIWKYKLPIDLGFEIHYLVNSKAPDFGVEAKDISINTSLTLFKG